MKAITKIAVSILMVGTVLLANENIDTQIQKIQNAQGEQRVELMNEFKKQLQTMNQEDRAEAIAGLRGTQSARVESRSNEMAQDTQMMQENQRGQMDQREALQQFNPTGNLPTGTNGGTTSTGSTGGQTPYNSSAR